MLLHSPAPAGVPGVNRRPAHAMIKFPGCGDALQCAMGYFIWRIYKLGGPRACALSLPSLPPRYSICIPVYRGYRFSLLPAALDVLSCGDFPAGVFRYGDAPAWKLNARFGSARPRRGHLTTSLTILPVNASKSLASLRDKLLTVIGINLSSQLIDKLV